MFSTSLHKKYFKYIKSNLNNRKYFVLIGHPKSLLNKKNFTDFFSVCDKYDKNANFLTVVDLYKHIKNDN